MNQYAPPEQKAIEVGGIPDDESVQIIDSPAPAAPAPQLGGQRLMPPVVIDGVKHEPRRPEDPEPRASRVSRMGSRMVPAKEPEPELVMVGETPPPISGKIAEVDSPHAMFKAPGKAATPEPSEAEADDPMVLVNLQGRPRIFREATDDEILEAEEGFEERQMLAIKLGQRDYLVVRRSEAEQRVSGA